MVSSPAFDSFKRNELSNQVLELAWERLSHGREKLVVQLATDSGQ
jgi:hypothetical protein